MTPNNPKNVSFRLTREIVYTTWIKKGLTGLFLLVFRFSPAEPKAPYDLPDLLSIAEEQSPAIIQAREALQAAEGRTDQARLYPNPVVEAGTDSLGTSDRGRTTGFVGQPLIVGGRRRADVRLNLTGREAARQELQQTHRNIYRQVTILYAENLFHRDNIGLSWKIAEDAEQVHAIAQTLVEQGSAPLSSLQRTAAATEEAYLDVTRHIAELTFAAQRLSVLLGGFEFHTDELEGELLQSRVNAEMRDARRRLLEEHPELLAVAERVRESEQRRVHATREAIPDVTIRGGGGVDHATEEGFLMIGLSVPIPLWDRNQGRIRELEAETRRLAEARDDTERSLENDLVELQQRINELDTFVEGYREVIVPPLEEAYKAVREDYAAGRTTIHDVLSSQGEYFRARRQLLENRWFLSEAHARLRYYLPEGRPDIFAARVQ